MHQIMARTNLPKASLIVCRISLFLNECLVKLRFTKEKPMIIVILLITETYERKEKAEMRWINERCNLINTNKPSYTYGDA